MSQSKKIIIPQSYYESKYGRINNVKNTAVKPTPPSFSFPEETAIINLNKKTKRQENSFLFFNNLIKAKELICNISNAESTFLFFEPVWNKRMKFGDTKLINYDNLNVDSVVFNCSSFTNLLISNTPVASGYPKKYFPKDKINKLKKLTINGNNFKVNINDIDSINEIILSNPQYPDQSKLYLQYHDKQNSIYLTNLPNLKKLDLSGLKYLSQSIRTTDLIIRNIPSDCKIILNPNSLFGFTQANLFTNNELSTIFINKYEYSVFLNTNLQEIKDIKISQLFPNHPSDKNFEVTYDEFKKTLNAYALDLTVKSFNDYIKNQNEKELKNLKTAPQFENKKFVDIVTKPIKQISHDDLTATYSPYSIKLGWVYHPDLAFENNINKTFCFQFKDSQIFDLLRKTADNQGPIGTIDEYIINNAFMKKLENLSNVYLNLTSVPQWINVNLDGNTFKYNVKNLKISAGSDNTDVVKNIPSLETLDIAGFTNKVQLENLPNLKKLKISGDYPSLEESYHEGTNAHKKCILKELKLINLPNLSELDLTGMKNFPPLKYFSMCDINPNCVIKFNTSTYFQYELDSQKALENNTLSNITEEINWLPNKHILDSSTVFADYTKDKIIEIPFHKFKEIISTKIYNHARLMVDFKDKSQAEKLIKPIDLSPYVEKEKTKQETQKIKKQRN